MFSYLGLVLVIASWLAGGYVVTKWRDRSLATISEHAASAKEATLIFAATLVSFAGLFYLWLIEWFAPQLQLNWVFTAVLTITLLCAILAAVIPDTVGRRSLVHRAAAYTMAVLFLPLTGLIILSPELALLAKTICAVAAVYMIITFVFVVMLGKAKSHFLTFQALYIVVFQAVVLTAAYL